MKQYNEKLAQWVHSIPSSEAGINNIQIPGKVEHVVWQNRYKAPGPYENDFVKHLLAAFSNGATELEELVKALNDQGFRDEAGNVWSASSFCAEMQRLGY